MFMQSHSQTRSISISDPNRILETFERPHKFEEWSREWPVLEAENGKHKWKIRTRNENWMEKKLSFELLCKCLISKLLKFPLCISGTFVLDFELHNGLCLCIGLASEAHKHDQTVCQAGDNFVSRLACRLVCDQFAC